MKWVEAGCKCGVVFSIPLMDRKELIRCPSCSGLVVEKEKFPPQNENSPSPNRRRRGKRRWKGYVNGGPMKARR